MHLAYKLLSILNSSLYNLNLYLNFILCVLCVLYIHIVFIVCANCVLFIIVFIVGSLSSSSNNVLKSQHVLKFCILWSKRSQSWIAFLILAARISTEAQNYCVLPETDASFISSGKLDELLMQPRIYQNAQKNQQRKIRLL